MNNNKKLTSEEISELKKIQDNFLQLTAQMGQLHLEKLTLELQIEDTQKMLTDLKSKFIELKKEEFKLQDIFTKKYGSGTINLDTGEFITEV